MSKAASPIPKGFHTLTAHLTVKGAGAYIKFLQQAFGAVEVDRSTTRDGRLMHATVRIGDSVMMLNDFFPEFGGPPIAEGNWPFRLSLYVPDVDAAWAQALKAGCTAVFPLQDQFWGDRYGQVKDPFGFVWGIATRIEDLTQEESNQRQAKAFGA